MDTPESTLEKDETMKPESELPTPSMPLSKRLQSRMTSEVDPKWADAILLGCFFVAGIVDSVAYNKYTCFVSMQTG